MLCSHRPRYHVTSIDHYTTLLAQESIEKGRRTNVLELLVHPPLAFLRNYLLRQGFKDGTAGLLVSALNSYYVFMKLVKLWELQHRVSSQCESPLAHRRAKFDRAPNRYPDPGPPGSGQVPSTGRGQMEAKANGRRMADGGN